jgi:class 3 adenylate cyclase/tetratricopeptide (TPR) repeat protein
MEENEHKNFQDILQERERLEQILKQRFRKEIAILFTDICGYTEYIDKRGDISGRALLLKHNRIVLPLIEKHEGRVIEMIGDAVMAAFSTPLAAVKASMAIQKALFKHNKNTEAMDKIHVKMGIHFGKVLVDETAVYQAITGDVANVASRIQSEAGSGQILTSKAVYEEVCKNEDIICRFHKKIRVKGKAQPMEIYRVLWQNNDIQLQSETKSRPHKVETDKRGKQPLRLLQLEITLQGDRLKISAYEKIAGEESTIRQYEELPISMDLIKVKCHEMVDALNKADHEGCVTCDISGKLREIGQMLYNELFSSNVKETLKNTNAKYLSLKIDDQLVQIPWELLYDGKQFLCRRFHMGRLIKTRQSVLSEKNRALARPLKMLILADPEGDLKGAYAEGTQIRDYMDKKKDLINASFRSEDITPDSIKEKIQNFDLVHFAGHADYNPENAGDSGWRLSSGSLKARDIIKMAATNTMPTLIFSNACQSALTEEWALKVHFENEIFGMANAFLLAGVRHYIGTFWEISDEQSRHFALEFYKYLLSGVSIGEAIRESRLALIKQYGEENIVWTSYILYGDPTFNYREQVEAVRDMEEPEPSYIPTIQKEMRAQEEVIDFGDKGVAKKNRLWLSVGAAIAILITSLFLGYQGFFKGRIKKYEEAALTYYIKGNFEDALHICGILEEKDPEVRLSNLIRGNIYLANGKPDLAEESYQKALKAQKGTNTQKAHTLIGLGRIASIRNQTDEALKYYQQASEAAPESTLGYLSQAILLEAKGNHDKVMDLLGKAKILSPHDEVLKAFIDEARKKAALDKDYKKQERIDRLVKELLESMELPSLSLPSDGWTSSPLTLWVMDFEIQGYSLQEGQERLLVSGITNHIIKNSRAQVVERALLDKLMEELKLGTSKLIDRDIVLSLGRMLAARLILSGHLVYSGPQAQVSIRLIETETGRIVAAINESFGSVVPVSVLAERLSEDLLEKLREFYPLRGKISEVKDEDIKLNIGQMAGVKVGQRFKVIDKEVALEVISIQKNTCLARILEGKGPLQENLRVEGM